MNCELAMVYTLTEVRGMINQAPAGAQVTPGGSLSDQRDEGKVDHVAARGRKVWKPRLSMCTGVPRT